MHSNHRLKGNESIDVQTEFIDNKTEHATVVSYNYGEISSKKDEKVIIFL